jgi:hypothetical protein
MATGLVAAALLVTPRAEESEGPVWSWFATCDGPALGVEVQFDTATLFKSVIPLCQAKRTGPASQGQRTGSIHFLFKPERVIVWEGYRGAPDKTKAGQVLQVDIWQAGADPDDLLLGVSVSDAQTIYMNTIHIAHPSRRDESQIAKGLKLITYPLAERGEANK